MILSNFVRTWKFHKAMGIPARAPTFPPYEPTVEERILRAKLLMEETIETIEKGLGIHIHVSAERLGIGSLEDAIEMQHRGRHYDPIETVDGLADVKVIANGTAVQFGLPLREVDEEVYESNMSKLDENGRPVVNKCKVDHACEMTPEKCELIDPTKPVGKILKAAGYKPAMIGPLLGYTESNCPGHVGHHENNKVCRNCGVHVNAMRD